MSKYVQSNEYMLTLKFHSAFFNTYDMTLIEMLLPQLFIMSQNALSNVSKAEHVSCTEKHYSNNVASCNENTEKGNL
jgi:hypothetical protein